MNFEEYQKLLNDSYSYQSLDEELKKKILQAEGEEKENYIRSFQQEKEIIQKAYGEFKQETDQIVNEYKGVAVKNRKEKLLKTENQQREKEIDGAENLLNNL